MTPDRLRTAILRALHGCVTPDVLDELVAIANHHAAEESAATYTDATTGT